MFRLRPLHHHPLSHSRTHFSGDQKAGAHGCVPEDLMSSFVHTLGGEARVQTCLVPFRPSLSAESCMQRSPSRTHPLKPPSIYASLDLSINV